MPMPPVLSPPCFPVRQRCTASRQRGTGLLEFSIVAIPILLTALGGIEVAQWLLTRQAVSLALLEAGRAGSTAHAKPQMLATAFEQALLPLFPASSGRSARQHQHNAFQQRRLDTGAAAWQIEVLSPSSQAFHDFADPALNTARHNRLPTINNNYQLEQDQRHRAQGWPQGLGPTSGVSIYDANTLVLRLTYLHEPVVPGIKGLMRLLGQHNGTYGQHAMAHGYLPISRQITLTMQSHPVYWPALEDGHVIRPGPPPSRNPDGAAAQPCAGLWCRGLHDTSAAKPALPDTNEVGPVPESGGVTAPGSTPGTTPAPSSPGGDLTVLPDDPACGITLCCTPG